VSVVVDTNAIVNPGAVAVCTILAKSKVRSAKAILTGHASRHNDYISCNACFSMAGGPYRLYRSFGHQISTNSTARQSQPSAVSGRQVSARNLVHNS
jgi:hypothetical protein